MVIKFDYKFLLVIILTFSLFFIFFNYKMKNKENEIINLQNSILESEGFHKNEKFYDYFEKYDPVTESFVPNQLRRFKYPNNTSIHNFENSKDGKLNESFHASNKS